MMLFNDTTDYKQKADALIQSANSLYQSGFITMHTFKSITEKIRLKFKVELTSKKCVPFVLFWDGYDKKVGNKDEVEKSWNMLDFETQNLIISILPTFKSQFESKTFQMNPETFLNGKRWRDEIIIKTDPKAKISKSEIAITSHQTFMDKMSKIYGNGNTENQ